MFDQSAVLTDTAARRSVISAKKAALIYDKIYVLRTEEGKFDHLANQSFFGLSENEIDLLQYRGILEFCDDPTAKMFNSERPSSLRRFDEETVLRCFDYRRALVGHVLLLTVEDGREDYFKASANFLARCGALQMQDDVPNVKFVPLCYDPYYRIDRLGATIPYPFEYGARGDIGQASVTVIENIPMPVEETPWSKVIEFRENPENRFAYLSFRDWLREIGKEEMPGEDLRHKIEFEISKIKNALDLLEIEKEINRTEIVLTGATKLIQSIVDLTFPDLTEIVIQRERNRIAMMRAEAEMAEKNGLYYIHKVGQSFERNPD